MSTNPQNSLFATLSHIAVECQKIQVLLQEDANHFSQNNIAALETSNAAKTDLIAKINALIASIPHDTVAEAIKHNDALRKLMLDLKQTIHHCYRYLMTNNYIVHTNLNQLKSLWEQLNPSQMEAACTYEKNTTTRMR